MQPVSVPSLRSRLCHEALIVALALVAPLLPAYSQPLRDAAARRSIHIGTAVSPLHLNEPQYAAAIAREFDQVETENDMKFGPIHPEPDRYNFSGGDALVAFAREHKMVVRGHTLVWHRQTGSWVAGAGDTAERLSGILKDHIAKVVGHYAGQVYAWDVVNEAFNDDGSIRGSLWSDAPGIGLKGTAYIEQALRWAHEADPKAVLFYNDFSAETVNAKSDAIYKMAQDFKTRAVPLDGIGLQMHLTLRPGALASMEANIKRLTDLGLQVQITELDVRLPVDTAGKADEAALTSQAKIYSDILGLCLKFPKCTAVQLWGFTDRYSWVPSSFRGTGAALPFDRDYQPKPAYDALKNALLKER